MSQNCNCQNQHILLGKNFQNCFRPIQLPVDSKTDSFVVVGVSNSITHGQGNTDMSFLSKCHFNCSGHIPKRVESKYK